MTSKERKKEEREMGENRETPLLPFFSFSFLFLLPVLTDPQTEHDSGDESSSTLNVGTNEIDEPVPESDETVPSFRSWRSSSRCDERVVRVTESSPIDVDQ